MSSCGIFVIDNNFPSHLIEFLNIVISKNNGEQVGVVFDRIIGSSDPELFVDQVRQSVFLEGNGPLSGLFVPPD